MNLEADMTPTGLNGSRTFGWKVGVFVQTAVPGMDFSFSFAMSSNFWTQ
jgi:hypothetical protein